MRLDSIIAYSGFQGIYDVEHFIKSLRFDVHIVEKLPEVHKNGNTKKMKAYQVRYCGLIFVVIQSQKQPRHQIFQDDF